MNNVNNLISYLFEFDEMAIRQFKTVGDWNKASSFRQPVDRKLLTSPKAVEKIRRQWQKTPYDFDIYLVNDRRVNKPEFREVGEVDLSFVRDKLKLTPEEIPDPDPDAITVIYTNNVGSQWKMASGWILAHRLGHTLRLGRGPAADSWKYFADNLRKRIANFVRRVYNIDVAERGRYGFGAVAEKDKLLKYIARQLGTFKSARDNKLRDWYELPYELLAQYLITGKIKFNPLPRSLVVGTAGWGRKQTMYVRDEEQREQINQVEFENFVEELENDLEIVLDSAVGSIFVM